MEDVIDIASYICYQYKQRFCRGIDEMKLHKLLYFVQRKSIAETGNPMFDAVFHAWKYGPVIPAIRAMYKSGYLENRCPVISASSVHIVASVMDELAGSDSMLLSSISHGEISWQRARKRMLENNGLGEEMDMSDIREDAMRYRKRCELLKVWREFQTQAVQ